MGFFRRHRRSAEERLAEGVIGCILALALAIISWPFIVLGKILSSTTSSGSTTQCQVCNNLLLRKTYQWQINGRTTSVCPTCNSRLTKRNSSAALAAMSGKHGTPKDILIPLPPISSPTNTNQISFAAALILPVVFFGGLFFLLALGLVNSQAPPAVTQDDRVTSQENIKPPSPTPEGNYIDNSTKFPVEVRADHPFTLTGSGGIANIATGDTLTVLEASSPNKYQVQIKIGVGAVFPVDKKELQRCSIVKP